MKNITVFKQTDFKRNLNNFIPVVTIDNDLHVILFQVQRVDFENTTISEAQDICVFLAKCLISEYATLDFIEKLKRNVYDQFRNRSGVFYLSIIINL